MRGILGCRVCPWRGGFGDLARVSEGGKKVCICPECGRTEVFVMDKVFRAVFSTQQKTVKSTMYRKWVGLRGSTSISEDRTWVFTDGSSTGSFAAAVLKPGDSPLELVRHLEQPANRNVGCEIMAVALGLKYCGSNSRVTVVSDYIGTGAWLYGHWKVSDPAAVPRLGVVAHIIQKLCLDVDFIHHKGHLKDSSDFTVWNNRVDSLCSTKERTKYLEGK